MQPTREQPPDDLSDAFSRFAPVSDHGDPRLAFFEMGRAAARSESTSSPSSSRRLAIAATLMAVTVGAFAGGRASVGPVVRGAPESLLVRDDDSPVREAVETAAAKPPENSADVFTPRSDSASRLVVDWLPIVPRRLETPLLSRRSPVGSRVTSESSPTLTRLDYLNWEDRS